MAGAITVAILSYRRPQALQRCLDSLFAHSSRPPRVHILNQGFLCPRLQSLYAGFADREDVHVSYLDSNVGCAGGRNRLLDRAAGGYIFFADDDLVFTSGWDAPLVAALEREPALGAVSPYLREGHKLPFAGRFEWHHDVLRVRRYSRLDFRRFTGCVPTDFLPGGCVLMRREVFAERAFDEGCAHDLEDLDLWLQLHRSPWKLALCMDSTVLHQRPWVQEYDAERYEESRLEHTRQYFLRKWQLSQLMLPSSGPRWLVRLKLAIKRRLDLA